MQHQLPTLHPQHLQIQEVPQEMAQTTRTDLYSRPILSISRGPTFIPVAEDSEWYRTDYAAANRLGFRYVPAGINQPGFITPCRTIESNPTSFRISWEDRSPSLKVTKDGVGLGGSKGFRSARCNAPMREGKWYLEVKIEVGGGERVGEAAESKKEGSHVRLGWGRREAPLNGPVGLDGYSYGFRDRTGEKVALSRPRPYGKPFKSGDVVGMYISLPPLRQPSKKDPHDPAHLHRERIPIDLKGQEVFEILEYPVSKEMSALMEEPTKANNSASLPSTNTKKPTTGAKLPDRSNPPDKEKAKDTTPPLRPLPILESSRIAFFVNGECQGIAFQDLYDFLPLHQTSEQRKGKSGRRAKEGVKEHRENPFDDGTLGYYPMISVFNDAFVRVNPGPDFAFPPPPDIDALLDGRPQPEPPQPETISPIKQEPESASLDMKMDIDEDTKPIISSTPDHQTWRPAIERYPEFMQEQWALDALEEDEAKAEFEKQKAREEAGISSKNTKGRKSEGTTKKATKAGTGNKKKKTGTPQPDATSKAGTPAPDEAAGKAETTARVKKRSKKAEGQATLGVAASHVPPEAPTPRSATETPAGTPPPPSISSTAAAAAAAHLLLHHHAVGRQDLSNRPSPSPLRQSTAYRDMSEDDDGSGHKKDKGFLPVPPPPPPASHGPPRSRAPPGSKEGRQRAAAAAAAAHASTVASNTSPTSRTITSPVAPSPSSLMSLAAVTGSAAGFPSTSTASYSSKALSATREFTSPAPAQGHQYGGRVVEMSSSSKPGASGGYFNEFLGGRATEDTDVRADSVRLEEEEEEGGGASEYGFTVEEEEDDDRASVPAYEEEEGATTDGDSIYPYDAAHRDDVEMAGEESDDGGETGVDDVEGYERGETEVSFAG
ncbi:hypothetical protein EST38_g4861 [Candolleomyces aberdarensis]|uniref:B30.2/SPRY domain-containing protein n=1 Tax=Candolleomyces aberdarensis TaxID=2316362 RepID=A0A4Q2DLI4_9AGAR|nr:hypothetical protein EST38_g4861 [Candolleomyces aberdarensis]